jgi:hypothetical protein
MDITERVAKIEQQLVTILPTLATKSDLSDLKSNMHSEFNTQTWRIVTTILAAAGLVFAAVKLIP